jgi:hypothetical protein
MNQRYGGSRQVKHPHRIATADGDLAPTAIEHHVGSEGQRIGERNRPIASERNCTPASHGGAQRGFRAIRHYAVSQARSWE